MYLFSDQNIEKDYTVWWCGSLTFLRTTDLFSQNDQYSASDTKKLREVALFLLLFLSPAEALRDALPADLHRQRAEPALLQRLLQEHSLADAPRLHHGLRRRRELLLLPEEHAPHRQLPERLSPRQQSLRSGDSALLRDSPRPRFAVPPISGMPKIGPLFGSTDISYSSSRGTCGSISPRGIGGRRSRGDRG